MLSVMFCLLFLLVSLTGYVLSICECVCRSHVAFFLQSVHAYNPISLICKVTDYVFGDECGTF